MSERSLLESALRGRTVAVPETRQLDILVDLLARRGALVVSIPLVAILDTPDHKLVHHWLKTFIAQAPDYFIILTGEGLRRLYSFALTAGCHDAFTTALATVEKICRGPKPGRALRELGLSCDRSGKQPTTAGIIATLDEMPIDGKNIAVQLYGEDPNDLLINYLHSRQVRVTTVAPYVYAPKSDTDRVLALIQQLSLGEIDVIAFTSQPQFARLLAVAKENQQEQSLFNGLSRTLVAAIGPVVAAQLQAHGVAVSICPSDSFFMKPLVTEIEKKLAASAEPSL